MGERNQIKSLPGPILVIGASGFIGANLMRSLLSERNDAVGTYFSGDTWRLNGLAESNLAFLNLHDPTSIRSLLQRLKPKTIFDCSSFGAYSFEQDCHRIHQTNYMDFIDLMEAIEEYGEIKAYVHAGSSSEYGVNSAAPKEDTPMLPNSHYAVSKAAASLIISYYGRHRQIPAVNLRLYSVYGPYEDSSRLIPTLCEKALQKGLPQFAQPGVARDFIHVDDICRAFYAATQAMTREIYGESFNIGTGIETKLADLAALAQKCFNISEEPVFSAAAGRAWDVMSWSADPTKAKTKLGWEPHLTLEEGLISTGRWWANYLQQTDFQTLTKKSRPAQTKTSVSAIIACYRDEPAIPIMHQRLTDVFNKCGLDYEIIFVNDCSPDNSLEVIRSLSAQDPHVIGISHSRNFGSQAAFRSGMEVASKEACVLLDGDLQDPPELIEQFVEKWRAGADIVYGRRIKREMPRWLEFGYKGFYRLFATMSEIPMPKDAGDFSLIDRSAMFWMLQCRERDSFLRGLRSYVGFKQEGVDYVRPERMFGRSTNNWVKNIGWAKKAIFSFSRMPLHLLTTIGGLACLLSFLLIIISLLVKIMAPGTVPQGMTFLPLLIMTFGSATLFGIGLLGEYIGKILEETKARPPFIRKHMIIQGTVRPGTEFNKTAPQKVLP